MASSINTTKEVATEILPLIRVYKDGTVERIILSPYVPPDSSSPTAAVSSKDITISTDVSARLYLPNLTTTEPKKLPILVYFHGGGFCIESAFSFVHHRFMTSLVSESKAIALSVEYRLAPEHPLPAAYHDCWAALKWVASNFSDDHDDGKEPWLIDHGDRNRLFIGGDSAGANIAHNIAMRLGNESLSGSGGGDVKILGAFLTHPYFWGSEPVGSEPNPLDQNTTPHRVWMLGYPDAPGGIDNPMINPFVEGAPSLSGLLGGGSGGRRLLVGVAEKDELRERGVWYYRKVKESGWEGDLEKMFEMKGEGHAFHILDSETANAKRMIKLLASFINPN